MVLLQAIAFISARNKWRRYGKDYKQRAVAPFFGRPDHVSVMQASFVANNRLSSKDVSASIIDLAIRGYLKVIESKDGRKTKHTLELLKPADSKLLPDEKTLLKALFKKQTEGETFIIEDNKHKMSSTLTSLNKELESQAKRKGFYEVSPSSAGKYTWKELLGSFILLVFSFMAIEVVTSIPLISGVITLIGIVLYTAFMTKRSRSGVMLKEHVDGLKLYLDKAEKDRLKMQDAVAAPLAARGKLPVYDRKFFEKLLPFAIAAGVEKSWAKSFNDIYTNPPDWYQGNWSTFNTLALASSLSSTTTATSQTFSAPSSSGGSGFSGGSAGGGGGGGGGGGW